MTIASVGKTMGLSSIQIRRAGIGCSCGLLLGLTSCQPPISQAELTQQHQAAIAENDRLTQANVTNLSKDWQFTLQGQTNQPLTLNWPTLTQQATTTIHSQRPYAGSPKGLSEFRGVSVGQLLDRVGIEPGVTEATIVAADSYYVSLPIQNLIRHQALLAITENGKPMRRQEGGPLHLVYLNNDSISPKTLLQQNWVYYVTHVIIGNEPLKLKIGPNTLDRRALEQLPSHKITNIVGYSHGWKPDPVALIGVKLQDILRRQKIKLTPQSILKIRRKSMDDRDPQKSVRIPASILDRCDVILAHRWGTDAQTIPTNKGGPLTLAYGTNCTSTDAKNLAWLPFVESLTVEHPTSPKAKP
jgi:DMSO/TMAO reductase YedYZ molybdopterin-dependent catalytic subunit